MRDEGPAICNRGRNKTDCKGISKGIKSDCKSLDPWGPVVFNRGRVTREKFKKANAIRLTPAADLHFLRILRILSPKL